MALLLNKDIFNIQIEGKPKTVGTHFILDVIKEAEQKIMLLKGNLVSFTVTKFIEY